MTGWRRGLALLGLVVAATAPAQPKKERLTYSWMMELRHQLWQECREASPELLAAVAADLVSDGQGNPLVPMARALARARGVEADPAFVFRYGVQCLATPEVIDLDRFEQVTLTMHTPYRPPAGEAIGFAWRVLGGEGVSQRGEKRGTFELMRYRTQIEVAVDDWPDGAYRVETETEAGHLGESGRPQHGTDPVARTRVEVLRGFPQRFRALQEKASELRPRLDPQTRLTVAAAVGRVHRAYVGEPRRGRRLIAEDLAEAEAIVANAAEGRPVLFGLDGWVTTGVPVEGDEAAEVCVRLPPLDSARRPVLLFVPGAPAWDHRWSRPTSPAASSPHWLRDVLQDQGLDAGHRWLVAVMESPGRLRRPDAAVAAAVSWLRRQFRAASTTVLVGEREGASAIARALTDDADLASGVALVCGGSLDQASAVALAGVHFLAAPGRDHPANVNLRRAVTLLREAGAPVRETPAETCPWQIAVPLLLPEIEKLMADALE